MEHLQGTEQHHVEVLGTNVSNRDVGGRPAHVAQDQPRVSHNAGEAERDGKGDEQRFAGGLVLKRSS
jgi:hypothetical protein